MPSASGMPRAHMVDWCNAAAKTQARTGIMADHAAAVRQQVKIFGRGPVHMAQRQVRTKTTQCFKVCNRGAAVQPGRKPRLPFGLQQIHVNLRAMVAGGLHDHLKTGVAAPMQVCGG